MFHGDKENQLQIVLVYTKLPSVISVYAVFLNCPFISGGPEIMLINAAYNVIGYIFAEV